MKTKLLTLIATLASVGTSFAQAPAPIPEPAPVVLFAATPEKPYTLVSVATPEFTEIRVTNHADRTMEFAVRVANVQNVDTSEMSILSPAVATLKAGETTVVKRFRPENSTLPIGFNYSFDFTLQKEQATFDVSKDPTRRSAHPMPPQSEWSKLPNYFDVAARGELEPYGWYMGPNGRPTQALKYESKASDSVFGKRNSPEKMMEYHTAMKNGANPIALQQKMQMDEIRAFHRERMARVPVRTAAQSKRISRGSRRLTAEEAAAETARDNEQITRGR